MSWKERATPVSGWKARATPVGESVDSGDVGSPLEAALKAQAGDVVTVDTPTGPAQFTRKGERVMSAEEREPMFGAMEAGARQRGLEGALSFLSGGGPLLDELRGFDAGARAFLRREGDAGDAYRQVRDETRAEVSKATGAASPIMDIGGVKVPVLPALGAAAPSLLAPNPATIAGRIGLGGYTGASSAAANSEARDWMGLAEESFLGGALGAGTTAAMEPVVAGIGLLMKGAGDKIAVIRNARAAKDAADVASELESLRGALRAEQQKGSRLFENTQRALGGTPAGGAPVSPAIQQKAAQTLADPSTARLQEQVLENSIEAIPAQTRRIMGLEHEVAEETFLAPSKAAQQTQDYFSGGAWARDIRPRINRQLGNAALGGAYGLPGAGVALATGHPGLAALSVMGAATAAGQKGAITSARNALASPRVQTGALQQFIEEANSARTGLMSSSRAAVPVGQETQDETAINAFLRGG
jgi:hypothetical protein